MRIPDVECTNSPQYLGVHETELPYQFDWTDVGTPSAVTSVKLYNRAGIDLSTDAIGGTAAVSGNYVNGFTVSGATLTANEEYYLVCLATIGGRVRGAFTRLIVKPFP